jgi:hypothetical protein
MSSEFELSLHCSSEFHLHPFYFAPSWTCQEAVLGRILWAFIILVLDKPVRLHGDAAIWTGNPLGQIGRRFHFAQEYTFREVVIVS